MVLICITGTPGTGKSTLAQKLSQQGFHRLDLHTHYEKLATGFNKAKDCYDLDIKKVIAFVKQQQKKHPKIVLDSHISHYLPSRMVDVCIVCICSNLKTLEKRLQVRHYSAKKVRENLDAEIFQICRMEALAAGHSVIVVDSARKINFTLLLLRIKRILTSARE